VHVTRVCDVLFREVEPAPTRASARTEVKMLIFAAGRIVSKDFSLNLKQVRPDHWALRLKLSRSDLPGAGSVFHLCLPGARCH